MAARPALLLLLVGLVCVGVCYSSDVLSIDYEEYPAQLAQWEQHVQDVVLNGPSADDLTTEDVEEERDDRFGDDVDLHEDAEEEDPDMRFGDDEDAQDEIAAGLLSNLDISDEDEHDAFQQEEQEDAEEFMQFHGISSEYPTQDYIDLRVPDVVTYDPKAKGQPIYSAATAEESKDAIALIRRMYSPHTVVHPPTSAAASTQGVTAEIYMRKQMSKAADTSSVKQNVVANIDLGGVEEDLGKDWDIVQKHFKAFAHTIQQDSRMGVKKLANWSSMVRTHVSQSAAKFKNWAKSIKYDAHEKWIYLQKQARKASNTIKGLLVCPNITHKSTKPQLNKASGVSADDTAYVVLRGHDAVSDWVHNFKHEQVECAMPGCLGRVHHGFKECYDAIRNPLINKLTMLSKSHNIKRIVVTGYSLGGAVGVLHAMDGMHALPTVSVGLVTFGQPKVGDEHFAKQVDVELPSYPRVVAKFQKAMCNCESEERSDYVTSLPKSGFAHAGMEVSVPCFVGDCNTRCCPQNVINQIKCHSLERYLQSTWSTMSD